MAYLIFCHNHHDHVTSCMDLVICEARIHLSSWAAFLYFATNTVSLRHYEVRLTWTWSKNTPWLEWVMALYILPRKPCNPLQLHGSSHYELRYTFLPSWMAFSYILPWTPCQFLHGYVHYDHKPLHFWRGTGGVKQRFLFPHFSWTSSSILNSATQNCCYSEGIISALKFMNERIRTQ